jgi:Domain of unknown function (DUF6293)/DUF6293 C-terminal winged helix domain
MSANSSRVPFVSRRVHVAAVGFEVDRVAEPIIRMRGELAILIANLASEDLAARFRDRILERLRRARIETEVVRAPIFDLYSTTQETLRVLRAHAADRVYVNVSSGSKVQALSGYIATSLARAEGVPVEAYYAEPEGYAPTSGQPLSHGFRQAFSVPSLTVRTPSPALREAMELLEAGPLAKLDLAISLAREGILDASRLGSTGRPRDDASRVSLQTAIDVKVIRPLADWGFIRTDRVGKSLRVSLTEEGKLGLRLYRREK